MISSMTAFARTQTQIEQAVISWEIKSVNHRYLECWFRMPDEFRYLEAQCRAMMRDGIHRGKLDCQLKMQFTEQNTQAIQLNEPLIQSLLAAAERLSAQAMLANDMTVSHILQFPGVVSSNQPDNELLSTTILSAFQQGLNQLTDCRQQEGQRLQQLIIQRLADLTACIDKARQVTLDWSLHQKTRLLAKLEQLQLTVPEGRVEQEIAILLTRMDVAEELDRLATHCLEVKQVLVNGKVSGRKLDFLMQELNREANTLSAKSDTVSLTQLAVEMKVLIEQMREQIQNIE